MYLNTVKILHYIQEKKSTFNQKNVKKYESRLIILRSRRKK